MDRIYQHGEKLVTEKFENLQVMTGAGLATAIGAKCESFKDWPSGGLPGPMLRREEFLIETEFGALSDIKAGTAPKKAERALAAAYGSHPVIRTSWGLLYGRTTKCSRGTKKYHSVEIHSLACWALDIREIGDRFGSLDEFNPFADVAYELMKYEVSQQNAEIDDFKIEVARDIGASLLEISCKFKPSGEKTEEAAAFSILMRFIEKLARSGRLGEIALQSCNGTVLQQAMISALWSADMGVQLDAIKKISGAKAKICRFADMPVLNSEAVAAAVMTLGVNAGKWPRASYPDDVIAVHKKRLDQALRLEHPKLGVRERSKMVKEGLAKMMTPGPVLRSHAGMIRLALHTVENQGSERGAYQMTIYLARRWESEEGSNWSDQAVKSLTDRSSRLLRMHADYEIEVEGCADVYGLLRVSCDFDLYGGEEAQIECKQSLVDYVFTIFATGMIDQVMADSCSNVKPVILPMVREAV